MPNHRSARTDEEGLGESGHTPPPPGAVRRVAHVQVGDLELAQEGLGVPGDVLLVKARKRTPRSRCFRQLRSSSGASSRHGTHQEAQ